LRYYKKSEVVLSEDNSSQPKEIRFQDCIEITDTTSLVDGGGNVKSYPTGTYAVDMSEVSEGRWLYLKGDQVFTFSLSGGPAIEAIPSKPIEMWVKYTSLSITTTQSTRVTIGIAGE